MSQFNFNSTCAKNNAMITLTGQIFDTTTQQTLPFANVYLSNDTTIGTAANEEGMFTIDVPRGSKLTVSFVGYHDYEFLVNDGFTKVFLTADDQLDTVYLEGENKKKKGGWFWWLFFGGLAVGAVASQSEEKKPALGQPINVKL